ncbi:acyl carrier protein [Salinisphaera hydrothermalis]|uniref:Acyl carrier protein n=1 Tax=Salinisphaera hydrothermalis (strain C41B8) TaxID=1304275 RepID=A0A084IHE1_SALHC|nr:phosphopantetheine-binding protein [Salinisphaera hydrothermalis]KEZ76125.1 acyl carrier protein [Salinisphaera hydrothermalis C41B8]
MSVTVQEQVFAIIAEHGQIDAKTITPESTLADLGIASLEAMEIVFDIEEHFDINLPDRDPNFDTDTAQGLIDAIDQGLQQKAASSGLDARLG